MTEPLTPNERALLLKIAHQAIQEGVHGRTPPPIDLSALPPSLSQPGVCFVTLTIQGELRGCIGALEAYQPLAEDVQEHAIAAALNDYRFPPVRPEELALIHIEISRLTQPQPLHYERPMELLEKLRPGVDGVLLSNGFRRSTFLPQVWEKIPNPAQFLDHLCMKMGADENLWRYQLLDVYTYQVEEFQENQP